MKKRCSRCRKRKDSRRDFGSDHRSKDGRQSQCLECRREVSILHTTVNADAVFARLNREFKARLLKAGLVESLIAEGAAPVRREIREPQPAVGHITPAA